MSWTRWLAVLFLGALGVAVALTVIGIVYSDDRSKVALEAAKAGIQLGAITLIGAAVTQGLKQFNDARADRQKRAEVEREERHRLNEYRMTVFRDTVDAYNSVKAVRRTLRAVGLPIPSDGSLRPDQVVHFDEQMRALNEAELSLEKIEREVSTQRESFANAWAEIDGLKKSEDYLRDVLTAWETGALLTSERKVRQQESLEKLTNFLARRREVGEEVFWGSFGEFERAIRKDLLLPTA